MDNNPCGLNKQDTLEDAIKRADELAPPDGSSHTGMMCDNKDLRRIVLLVKEYRKLKEQQLTEDELLFIITPKGLPPLPKHIRLAKKIIAKMKEKAE